MKKIIIIVLSGFIYMQCYAQTILTHTETKGRHDDLTIDKPQDSITISKDTINLRGIIYETDGKPAKNIEVELLENEFHPHSYVTKTDSTGFFELKGAKPYDTLRIVDMRYIYFPFPNKGSRFMIIYLPSSKVLEINSSNPIEIKASRKYPKKTSSFRIAVSTPIFDNGCLASIVYPEFIGGPGKFLDYIKKNIVYPDKAIDNNIEGTVEVVFTIEKDGSISGVNILKGIGYDCDEQVVQLIKKSPKWTPGILCGKPAIVQETASVKFSLIENN